MYNTQDYVFVFLEELEEQIQILDEDIKKLMLFDVNKTELIDEVFRITHTLKGSAASYGFDVIAQLSHAMEDILSALKNNRVKINMTILDTLFECLDKLRVLKEKAMQKDSSLQKMPPDVSEIINCLRAFAGGEYPSSVKIVPIEEKRVQKQAQLRLTLAEKERLLELKKNGKEIFYIVVLIDENCFMKSVQAFLALNNLKEIGEVFKSNPSVEQLEADEIENTLAIVAVTNANEAKIRKLLDDVTELEIVEIKKFEFDDLKIPLNILERKSKRNDFLRINICQINHAINMVEKINKATRRLEEITAKILNNYPDNADICELAAMVDFLKSTGEDLSVEVEGVKKLPLKKLLQRFERTIENLALKNNKQIHFVLEGDDANLEAALIREIDGAVTHLVRNAAVHGIEMPEVRLKAGKTSFGTIKINICLWKNLIITVEDDGKGIDIDSVFREAIKDHMISKEDIALMSRDRIKEKAINLLFEPGFSTMVNTNDFAGRGVGLDAVKKIVEQNNGTIQVDTKAGEGTKFTLSFKL